jgi:uncharacterized protein RhaS with RHS repeats
VGMYHFPFRSYSPELGRWMQRDPLGYVDGPNLYQVVLSRAMTFVDPLGLVSVCGDGSSFGIFGATLWEGLRNPEGYLWQLRGHVPPDLYGLWLWLMHTLDYNNLSWWQGYFQLLAWINSQGGNGGGAHHSGGDDRDKNPAAASPKEKDGLKGRGKGLDRAVHKYKRETHPGQDCDKDEIKEIEKEWEDAGKPKQADNKGRYRGDRARREQEKWGDAFLDNAFLAFWGTFYSQEALLTMTDTQMVGTAVGGAVLGAGLIGGAVTFGLPAVAAEAAGAGATLSTVPIP